MMSIRGDKMYRSQKLLTLGLVAAGFVAVETCNHEFEKRADIGIKFKDGARALWLRDHGKLPDSEIRKAFEAAYETYRIRGAQVNDTVIVQVELPGPDNPWAQQKAPQPVKKMPQPRQ
ncbi:MAG: hypothetical protein WBK91_10790 [Alphaproteobacteria bacterium]